MDSLFGKSAHLLVDDLGENGEVIDKELNKRRELLYTTTSLSVS